mmetsp:Transcript_16588/g.14424  ORF Transcript_16588/g.14424 Transcript_16588/m.14424 type:complete len:291 (-) Transcript_16588:2262-3134(-)
MSIHIHYLHIQQIIALWRHKECILIGHLPIHQYIRSIKGDLFLKDLIRRVIHIQIGKSTQIFGAVHLDLPIKHDTLLALQPANVLKFLLSEVCLQSIRLIVLVGISSVALVKDIGLKYHHTLRIWWYCYVNRECIGGNRAQNLHICELFEIKFGIERDALLFIHEQDTYKAEFIALNLGDIEVITIEFVVLGLDSRGAGLEILRHELLVEVWDIEFLERLFLKVDLDFGIGGKIDNVVGLLDPVYLSKDKVIALFKVVADNNALSALIFTLDELGYPSIIINLGNHQPQI